MSDSNEIFGFVISGGPIDSTGGDNMGDPRFIEYQSLRNEILDRIRLRQQILFAMGFWFVALICRNLDEI